MARLRPLDLRQRHRHRRGRRHDRRAHVHATPGGTDADQDGARALTWRILRLTDTGVHTVRSVARTAPVYGVRPSEPRWSDTCGRVTRHASAAPAASIAAARKNGVPGRCQAEPGAMDQAKVWLKSHGPTRPASAVRLEVAPCSWPCSEPETSLLISAITAALPMPHSASTGMPAQNIHPVEARP